VRTINSLGRGGTRAWFLNGAFLGRYDLRRCNSRRRASRIHGRNSRPGSTGLKVALIEKSEKLGEPACMWAAFPPSRCLQRRGLRLREAARSAEYGIEWARRRQGELARWLLRAAKTKIITKHVKGLDFLMRKNEVTVISGSEG